MSNEKPTHNWHADKFFGLHYDFHATATGTGLGAGLTYEHLRAEIEKVDPDWVQCDCKGHPGYTSWPTEVGSTSPGVVNDALRIHRDVTRDLGIPLVVHYSGVHDARALQLHPEWAAISAEGLHDTYATCNLSPYTDELMIPQMIEIIDKYDVDGFWVDGECWGTMPCHCNRCTSAFTAQTGIENIPKTVDGPNWPEWAAFHVKNFEEHVRKFTVAVHERKSSCMVCSNWMYTLSLPTEIKAPVDFLSGDFCNVWGLRKGAAEARFLDSRGLTWDLMGWGFTSLEATGGRWTFKTSAQICQEIAPIFALGGAAMVYSQPRRDGRLVGWQQDILGEVARFAKSKVAWCHNTETVPQAAVLVSAGHFRVQREGTLMFPFTSRHDPLIGAQDILIDNHINVDMLSDSSLIERAGEYKLIVVPEQANLGDTMIDALTEYVENGGKLILSGAQVADELGELAGVNVSGDRITGSFYLPAGREATDVSGQWQPIAATDSQVVLRLMKEPETGPDATDIPAITIRGFGKGQVMAIHGQFFSRYATSHYPRTRQLMADLLRELSPDFMVEMDGPVSVQMILRRKDGKIIVHLLNEGNTYPTSPTRSIVEEVPSVGPVKLRMKCEAKPSRVFLANRLEGLQSEWREGVLQVYVQGIGIMDSVIIEFE